MIDHKYHSKDTLPVTPPTENEIIEINTFIDKFLKD